MIYYNCIFFCILSLVKPTLLSQFKEASQSATSGATVASKATDGGIFFAMPYECALTGNYLYWFIDVGIL